MKHRTCILAFLCIAAFSVSSIALTSGPTQPEYSSFEPVDATDLVNLPTGDFSYPIPLGSVKTPDGTGYPIVLSYHAGIQNEQEATWVGLGWSLNVGAINRQVRTIPDDYNNSGMLCYTYNKGERGWSFQIGGGFGPIAATIGFSGKAGGGIKCEGLSCSINPSIGINLGGGATLGLTLSNNLQNVSVGLSVGPMDLGIGSRGVSVSDGFGVTDKKGTMGASLGMGMNMSWQGDASVNVSGGAKINKVGGFSLSSQGGVNVSVAGIGMSMSPGSSFNKNGLHQSSKSYGFSIPLPCDFSLSLGYQEWNWYYENLETEQMVGDLFNSDGESHSINTDNRILANAIGHDRSWPGAWKYYNKKDDDSIKVEAHFWELQKNVKTEYIEQNGYNFPSQDIFSASGQGMSGQFMAFRYTSYVSCYSPSDKLNGNAFKATAVDDDGYPSWNNNLRPLNLDSMYFGKNFSATSGRTFKMLDETALNLVDSLQGMFSYTGSDMYKNIANYSAGKKIIPLFMTEENKLDGFVITDQEGKSYYYTVPLLTCYQTTYVNEARELPDLKKDKNNSFRRMNQPYATAWLLTAITGPDYIKTKIDSNASADDKLLPNHGDWGYWVRFRYEYGLPIEEDAATHTLKVSDGQGSPYFIPKAAYAWRMPFWDSSTAGEKPHLYDECKNVPSMFGVQGPKTYSSMFGMKEVTYLKSIETASEVAYFRTSERLDGYGIDKFPYFEKNSEASLENTGGMYLKTYPSETAYTSLLNSETDDLLQIAPDSGLVSKNGTIMDIDQRLNRCMIVHVPETFIGAGTSFTGMKPGDLMLKMKFDRVVWHKRSPHWYSRFYNCNTDYRTDNSDCLYYVVMDTTGCSYVAGKPTNISSRFDGSVTLSDPVLMDDVRKNILFSMRFLSAGFISMPIGKCVYAKDLGPGKGTDLYIVAYTAISLEQPVATLIFKTDFPELSGSDDCGNWNFDRWQAASFTGVELGPNYIPYIARRDVMRYVKKLDEIAWYSKAAYPFLTGAIDPEEAYAKAAWKADEYPFPESYKRIKFRYNYELAKGTPNSKAREKGRLTLKEVYVQAGPKDAPVNMPPYLFTYQGVSDGYVGYKDVDAWGYKKSVVLAGIKPMEWDFSLDPRDVNGIINLMTNKTPVGVDWNLSQIVLPSCGTMTVDYERDKAYSSWASIYQMHENNKCEEDYDIKDYGPPSIPGRACYTVEKTFTYTPGQTVLTFGSGGLDSLEKGMLVVVYQRASVGGTHGPISYSEANFLYRIVKINGGDNTIVIDRPITASEHIPLGNTIVYSLKGIKKHEMLCDGVRVSKIQTKAFSGVYTTAYNYPQGGVVEGIPETIIPAGFKDASQNANILGNVSDDLIKLINLNDFSSITASPNIVPDTVKPNKARPFSNVTNSYYEYWYTDWRPYGRGADNGQNWLAGDSLTLTWNNSYTGVTLCDVYILYSKKNDSCLTTTRHVTIDSIDYGAIQFPTPDRVTDPNVIGAVAIPYVTLTAKTSLKFTIKCTAQDAANPVDPGKGQLQIMGIQLRPIMLGQYYRSVSPLYSTGNTTVFYPVVEVKQTTPDLKSSVSGLTRYSYYTIDDNVPIGNMTDSTPLLHSEFINGTDNSTDTPKTIKVWRVYDRTSLVGLCKSIRQIQLNGDGSDKKVVSFTEKQYAFGDELQAKGAYAVTTPAGHLGDDQPLGLIRERSVRIEAPKLEKAGPITYTAKSVADVMKFKPLLIGVSNATDNVVKKTRYGFFDALTGSALATLNSGNAPTDTPQVSVTVPYRFLPGICPDTIELIREKNACSLPGASFISDNGKVETFPNAVSDLYPAGSSAFMRSATCNTYKIVDSNSQGNNFKWGQRRFQLLGEFRCAAIKPASFVWPKTDTTDWICDRRISKADMFGRPVLEIDAQNRKYALVHHPFLPTVVARIDGGSGPAAKDNFNDHCAMFTCDYEDVTPGYFDENNNWRKGVCYDTASGKSVLKLSDSLTHFGVKSVHVKNSQGPMATLKTAAPTIDGQGFIFSAWVYPMTGTTYIRFMVRAFWNGAQIVLDQVDTVGGPEHTTAGKWQIVKFTIPAGDIGGAADSIRIGIGNNETEPDYPAASKPEFYVDDIRFYPIGSFVSTYYYDPNLALPITFVDANNKAQYVKYDKFGRAIEKGVVKEN